MAVFSTTLNGISAFSMFGSTYGWNNGWFGYADFYAGDFTAPSNTATVTFAGSNWDGSTLRFAGEPLQVNITDTTVGNAHFAHLSLNDSSANVLLNNIEIDFITGRADAGVVNLTLGVNSVDAISLGDGTNTINTRTAHVGSVRTQDGNDRLIIGTKDVDIADLGDGNNRIDVATGNIGALRTRNGNDTLTINGGDVDFVDLGQGFNAVSLVNGGGIGHLRSDSGGTSVTMSGDSRILTMKMDRGTNIVTTGDGFVETFYSHEGTNRLNIGPGGFGAIAFSGTNQQQIIRANGYVASVTAFGDIAVDGVFNDGVDSLRLGRGSDRIVTGGQYATMINTGGGNDSVSIGTGGAGFVRLGDGNDSFVFSAFNPQSGVHVQGGAGIDTVNLGRLGGDVIASLNIWGEWQDVGTGKGMIGFTEIENLMGGVGNDRLAGDRQANQLMGGLGADTLDGGAGNDVLFGQAGADLSVFQAASGVDRIMDFQVGVDKIDLVGATQLADLRFIASGANSIVAYAGTTVVVNATLAALQVAGNFDF